MKFGIRNFVQKEDLRESTYNMELADQIATIASRMVFEAVRNQGLHDMTLTIKLEKPPQFVVEGYMFLLQGETPEPEREKNIPGEPANGV